MGGRGLNALRKIAMKQKLGHLMGGGGVWGVQNALFKIAAKQCLRGRTLISYIR